MPDTFRHDVPKEEGAWLPAEAALPARRAMVTVPFNPQLINTPRSSPLY